MMTDFLRDVVPGGEIIIGAVKSTILKDADREVGKIVVEPLVEEHFERFEQVYPERYEQHYGFLRPVIRETVYKYLNCGDLKQGYPGVLLRRKDHLQRCRKHGHLRNQEGYGSQREPRDFRPARFPCCGHVSHPEPRRTYAQVLCVVFKCATRPAPQAGGGQTAARPPPVAPGIPADFEYVPCAD